MKKKAFLMDNLSKVRHKGRRSGKPDMCVGDILKNETGGVALVLVIWVMVVLMAIVGEFTYTMRTEINITRNFKEEAEAYQLALAGMESAKVEILSVKEPAIVYFDEGNVLRFGLDEEEEEEPVRKDKLGNGTFEYKITDEDGKLNINNAPLDRLKVVFLDAGVEVTEVDTIVDSIMDWRDPNQLHMLNGAEEDYYRSLEKQYSCKDGPFDSVEELLLVKGMKPEILYGTKDEDEDVEITYAAVGEYLTVYDSGRININTAPLPVLEAMLGDANASNIITRREDGPILMAVSNGKISSEVFTIISTGANADGSIKRSVKAVVKKTQGSLETLYWNDNFIG